MYSSRGQQGQMTSLVLLLTWRQEAMALRSGSGGDGDGGSSTSAYCPAEACGLALALPRLRTTPAWMRKCMHQYVYSTYIYHAPGQARERRLRREKPLGPLFGQWPSLAHTMRRAGSDALGIRRASARISRHICGGLINGSLADPDPATRRTASALLC